MHLIYRSKKQTLPVVHDYRLAPYLTPVANHQSPPALQQKKSIDIILDRHVAPYNPSNQALNCYKPTRKSLYKPARNRKADSGYLRVTGKAEYSQPKFPMSRNKSTQIVDRGEALRRRGDSQYGPYMLPQRKSGSGVKLKAALVTDQAKQKDWICARLIEKEVYSIEESSDFC